MKVGILGATAYTSRELIKLLLRHPEKIEIAYLGSRREDPPRISDIFPIFDGVLDMRCAPLDPGVVPKGVELIFSTLPHAVSMKFVSRFADKGFRIIDFSADYRFKNLKTYEKWYKEAHTDPERVKDAVYGLPELFAAQIRKAQIVANPGCYPTSVILPLAPLLARKTVEPRGIIADSKSGVSGAGTKLDMMYHFSECNESIQAYKIGRHQHSPEMEEVLSTVSGEGVSVCFVPHLVPMDRGILSTIYATLRADGPTEQVQQTMTSFYAGKPFVRVKTGEALPRTKDVFNTNFCDIAVRVVERRVIIVSCIDNLMKGASSQAVQNMNVMFGFDEKAGLI
jgi:N-acetyl-gamma-glutamyl-phosphate reductase